MEVSNLFPQGVKMDHRFSGTLSFKSLLFSFSFDGRRLSLFPTSAEEEKEIERTWLKEEIAPGLFAGPRYPKIDTDFLTGIRNEDGHKIIFLVNKGSDVRHKTAPRCTVLYIHVYAYIDCKFERDSICKISFSGPEINLIHPANKAYELKINPDEWSKQGKVSIETTDFDAYSSENFPNSGLYKYVAPIWIIATGEATEE